MSILPTNAQLVRECIVALREAILHTMTNSASHAGNVQAMVHLDKVAHAVRILMEAEQEENVKERAEDFFNPGHGKNVDALITQRHNTERFGRFVLGIMTRYDSWNADMLDEIADQAVSLKLVGPGGFESKAKDVEGGTF